MIVMLGFAEAADLGRSSSSRIPKALSVLAEVELL